MPAGTNADRGWLLRVGDAAEHTLLVDEGAHELEYVVRAMNAAPSTATPIPPPAEGTWPIRAAVCGAHVELCAVVRWSAPVGKRVPLGGPERLGITVVRAGDRAITRQLVVDSADLFAGTAWTGGVIPNPSRPQVYVIEHATGGGIAVRAVDLETGAVAWLAPLPTLGNATVAGDAIQAIASDDGAYFLVAIGERRWEAFSLQRFAVIDTRTGAVTRTVEAPPGWRQVTFAAFPGSSALLAVRIAVRRDAGDSPTVSFDGLSKIDLSTAAIEAVFDPAQGPAATKDWVPAGAVIAPGGEIALTERGEPAHYPVDATAAAIQARRRDAVAALLAAP
ncbi:MAG: hypothetical protein K8W52_15420 [Deltaproteobacteria bacterium]|nr:hypothetical protein [Deltaproteobacteria bacterium]